MVSRAGAAAQAACRPHPVPAHLTNARAPNAYRSQRPAAARRLRASAYPPSGHPIAEGGESVESREQQASDPNALSPAFLRGPGRAPRRALTPAPGPYGRPDPVRVPKSRRRPCIRLRPLPRAQMIPTARGEGLPATRAPDRPGALLAAPLLAGFPPRGTTYTPPTRAARPGAARPSGRPLLPSSRSRPAAAGGRGVRISRPNRPGSGAVSSARACSEL